MNLPNDAQLKIRLPTELKQKIEQSALKFNRSLNSDILVRLNDSFIFNDAPFSQFSAEELDGDLDYTSIDRRKEVAIRLKKAVYIINSINPLSRSLKYSHIAFDNGFESAEGVLEWFQAKKEPTFNELRLLAQYFGFQVEWVVHGDSTPIPIKRWTFSGDVQQDIKDLLNIDTHEISQLLFVRDDSEDGRLLIVKVFETWKTVILDTNYHVSTVVGDGGRAQLRYMAQLWKQLYQSEYLIKTKSYLIAENKYDEILCGQLHPLAILDRVAMNNWWEAIWNPIDAQRLASQITPLWKDWFATCELSITTNVE